jgi:hypothetical protein
MLRLEKLTMFGGLFQKTITHTPLKRIGVACD